MSEIAVKEPKTESTITLVQSVEKRYSTGKSYMRTKGYLDKWPEYERFKAGDQWPPATDRTRSLPRPVFNIVRYIENHKVSSVMNENVKMIFTPQEAVNQATEDPNEALQAQAVTEAASTFSRFSGTVWENIKQDQLNEEALEVA